MLSHISGRTITGEEDTEYRFMQSWKLMLDNWSVLDKLPGLAFKLILKRNFQRTVGFAGFFKAVVYRNESTKRVHCLFISNVYVSKRDVFAEFCYKMGLEYFGKSIGERLQILIENLFFLSTLIYVEIKILLGIFL